MRMSAGLPELLFLSVGLTGACIAAVFAILAFVRTKQPAGILTKESATQVLRSETDIVRAAIHDQARWLRQELGASLTSFQEMTLTTFGTLRDGIDGQVRRFGERLDAGDWVREGRLVRSISNCRRIAGTAVNGKNVP